MANTPPKVFISYSWDSQEHKKWVKKLADDLSANGVYVILDQYENLIGRNITKFMDDAVKEADKIIIVFTEKYNDKAQERKNFSGYEYQMITTLWKTLQQRNEEIKVIPVLRSGTMEEDLPIYAMDYSVADMRQDGNYTGMLQEVLRAIFGVATYRRPDLGEVPSFLTSDGNDPPTIVTTVEATPDSDKGGPSTQVKSVSIDLTSTLSTMKEQMYDKLKEDKFKEVLEALEQYSKKIGDSDLRTFVIMKQANHHSLKKNESRGSLSQDQIQLQKNRLRSSIMDIVDEL